MAQINLIKRNGESEVLDASKMRKVIEYACVGYPECNPLELERDSKIAFRDGMTTKEIQRTITQVAVEKTSVETPNWQFVAARLLAYDLYKEAAINRGYYGQFGYGDFRTLITALTYAGVYGKYIGDSYTSEEINELGAYIQPERDDLLNYAGLRLLSDRYCKHAMDGRVMELPQERFMIIAMHLAIREKTEERVHYAKQFYGILSRLEITVATPTLANAGTPHHQLSSCFIDTVGDSLWSIYNTDAAFAQVSKHGGGFGAYIGKVRSRSSSIRGHEGAAGGVVPWIRGYNSTALAVDQLG